MKICLVSLEYPPQTGGGGIGTQTYLKARGLAMRGHDIHVVSSSCDKEPRTYRDAGATIHRIAQPSPALPSYEQSTYWLAYSMAVAEKLHALANEIAFDLIHFPEYCGEGFVYQTDTFTYRKARYVVQCHGPISMFAEHMGWPDAEGLLHKVGSFMERMVIHHADLVIASSFCTAAYCASKYEYPLENIHVVHSGIDTEEFGVGSHSPDARHPKLLFVGNFTGSKGFGFIVDTVLHMRERYPKIVVRMIGKGEDAVLRRTLDRIRAAGAESNFDVKGYVPYSELPGHYAWCDMFVGPSDFEPGPGNVYLEAMASGRPVIACNTGGAPEVIRDRCTGLLIEPRDRQAFERAIAALAEDASLRQLLARNGRSWVEENVSIDRYLNKIERLYQAVVST